MKYEAEYTASQVYIRTLYRTCMIIANAGYGYSEPHGMIWFLVTYLVWILSKIMNIVFIGKPLIFFDLYYRKKIVLLLL